MAKLNGKYETVFIVNTELGEEKVQELFLKIRENIRVRRFVRVEGKSVSYIHAGGKIGVLVSFDTEIDENNADFVTMGKNIAINKSDIILYKFCLFINKFWKVK